MVAPIALIFLVTIIGVVFLSRKPKKSPQ
jgi:hypothetical protein